MTPEPPPARAMEARKRTPRWKARRRKRTPRWKADDRFPDGGAACFASYVVNDADGAVAPNADLATVLAACPQLTDSLDWVDTTNADVPYASWPAAMKQRLAALYADMLAGTPVADLACPDPRGADSVRVPTQAGTPHNPPGDVFFTTAQATDMYLATVAHAIALEVTEGVPWSLLDYPATELAAVLSARALVAPVSQAPRPFGSPLPGATYQVPIAHVNSMGFVCDPRDGYDFLRGKTSETHADLVGATALDTLANLTLFLAENSVHGFPLTESIDTFQFTLAERLHRGLDLPEDGGPGTPSQWLIERVGCHSTAELFEELARTVNIPVANLGAYQTAWTDGTEYSFRSDMHRGLAYAWTRPEAAVIVPHADFVNATALWPNYRVSFGALDDLQLVWRTAATYTAMGLTIDMTLPVVAVVPANSNGSFETYFDFGSVFALLGDEGRYTLRTQACAWDVVRDYCVAVAGDGGTSAFANDDPYGPYPEYATPSLLTAAYQEAAACVAALDGGCSAVPASYPDFSATNWLP